ncbi:MAG: PilZ domain-containing protein [Gammaproteobacteria bacterium]|nr:PilZ domain-containing protein [Gammaproteobacteria bacterium]
MTSYSREYPRLATDLPVEVVLPADKVFHVHGVNISRSGIQIVCDGPTAAFFAGGQPERGCILQGLQSSLRIPLRWSGWDRVTVKVDCEAVSVRRESASSFCVGLRYKQFAGNGEAVMEDYIRWLTARPEHR